MEAAARFLRAKLLRLSLMYIQKSRPFITVVLRLSSNSASRWRRFYSPPRKSLHWGVAVGTTGILCGSVAFYAACPDSSKMADDGSRVSRDDFDSAVRNYLKDSDTKADYQTKIEDIRNWVDEQKKKGNENDIKAIGEALETTVIALEKFKTGDPYDITSGTLDIIASVAAMAGDPCGVAVAAFCAIAGAIVSANKPRSPSVVEQLAQVVHSELINFNRKLQDQNLSGLQGRIRRQLKQLQEMAPKEELDDADLWNDFDQFMGELRPRISSPLPFKYDKNLTTDPEMADFVKALETYCRAYTCFMALLTVAKVKFEELGGGREIETINRFIHHQRETAKEKMLFLSEEKHLTFLGRLPSEGGSLTKILLLSRNPTAKKMIESTRRELGLPVMPESEEVEEKAEKVSRQYVKLKWPAGYGRQLSNLAVFCNETDFPIRVVSGTVGKPNWNLKPEKDVKPHSSHLQNINEIFGIFSIGGYMKIAYNGRLSPKESENPNEGDVGIIEFAMSQNLLGGSQKINIQDKSDTTRTQGQDTYDKMTSAHSYQSASAGSCEPRNHSALDVHGRTPGPEDEITDHGKPPDLHLKADHLRGGFVLHDWMFNMRIYMNG